MTEMNFAILKENVLRRMKEKGLKQSELAEAIGMTQPNLNKCLQIDNDSRSFTLEQVWKLADFFETSIDELLGRETEKTSISKLEICQFLAMLISQNQISYFDYEKEETITYTADARNEDWKNEKTRTIKYNAFYFPNCYSIPDYIDPDDPRYEEVRSDLMYIGNEYSDNIAINNFLDRFIGTYEKFAGGHISEEEYKLLENAYYDILKKKKFQ